MKKFFLMLVGRAVVAWFLAAVIAAVLLVCASALFGLGFGFGYETGTHLAWEVMPFPAMQPGWMELPGGPR